MLEYWSVGVLEYWSVGVLEYWSVGVLDVIQTVVYKPSIRQYNDIITCSVKLIGHKQIQGVCASHLKHPNMPRNTFSITPILQYS